MWASLRYGITVSVLDSRPEVLEQALQFADQITTYFKKNSFNDYVNKMGYGRISDLIGQLDDSLEDAFLDLLRDPSVDWQRRQRIWEGIDKIESDAQSKIKKSRVPPMLRALTYDRLRPALETQLARSPLAQKFTIDQLFPPPPGLDQARDILKKRKADREKEMEEAKKRDAISRSS